MTPRSLWLLSSPAFPIALQRSRDRTQREPLGWPLAPHRKHPTVRQKHKVRTTTEMEIASKSNRYLEKDEGNVTKGISKAEEGSAEALCYRSRFHRRPPAEAIRTNGDISAARTTYQRVPGANNTQELEHRRHRAPNHPPLPQE